MSDENTPKDEETYHVEGTLTQWQYHLLKVVFQQAAVTVARAIVKTEIRAAKDIREVMERGRRTEKAPPSFKEYISLRRGLDDIVEIYEQITGEELPPPAYDRGKREPDLAPPPDDVTPEDLNTLMRQIEEDFDEPEQP